MKLAENHSRGISQERIKKETSVVERFEVGIGQIFFDGADLGLPTGLCLDVVAALVRRFGRVVPHAELHDQSTASEASDELRAAVKTVRAALNAAGIPCHVEAKRGYGYVLTDTPAVSR
ncbi:MAG: helix-turn-helix domain-containing protein [Lentisphaerae bacterium]|nr:helix-turn-helix domain-containing protein [Lentisphaerota bacterium]